ncbi:MAG: hypothetical protein RML95_12815 [Anaerolineae bacterium]|nr:hypothetical protein [Anaerolineae bacterium]MDW8300207.1 hypothetical protein [Anaerolineae bacterium]
MRRLLRSLDRALWLANLLNWFRVNIPPRRGVLILLAVLLLMVSLLVHMVYLVSGQNLWLGVCGFSLLHVALIMGFLGVLLSEALGKGYRE